MTKLVHKRIRMQIVLIVILCICYFAIPVSLAFFPSKVNQFQLFGLISFTWFYTFLQIPLTWILGWIYWYKAKKLDEKMKAVVQGELS